MGTDDEPAGLAATGVRLSYDGITVVDGAGIVLTPGRVTALVGPNGSGKSTLLRSLVRLHKLDAGSITFADGADLAKLSGKQVAQRITMLAQQRGTPAGITVAELVDFGRHPHRGRWRAVDPDGPEIVARAMEATGMTALAEHAVSALSGGQAQRAWLASCLAQDTPLLLLDEPTTYLDLRFQVEILDLVRDLADDHDKAVGIVLHDLDQAAAVADELVLLANGVVRAAGTPAEVLQPDLLTEVYGIRIDVEADPLTGVIRTRAVGRHDRRAVPAKL